MLQFSTFGFDSKCKRKSLDLFDICKSGCHKWQSPWDFLHMLNPRTFLSSPISHLTILPWPPHICLQDRALLSLSFLGRWHPCRQLFSPSQKHSLCCVKVPAPLPTGVECISTLTLGSAMSYSGWGRSDNVPVLSLGFKRTCESPFIPLHLCYHLKKMMPGLTCPSYPTV